jgi:hypothetical protein
VKAFWPHGQLIGLATGEKADTDWKTRTEQKRIRNYEPGKS